MLFGVCPACCCVNCDPPRKAPKQVQVVIAGITAHVSDECDDCVDFNGTYILERSFAKDGSRPYSGVNKCCWYLEGADLFAAPGPDCCNGNRCLLIVYNWTTVLSSGLICVLRLGPSGSGYIFRKNWADRNKCDQWNNEELEMIVFSPIAPCPNIYINATCHVTSL